MYDEHIVIEKLVRWLINEAYWYRVCASDVMKFSNPKLKVLSSLGIRGTKFVSVYNFPAQ